MASPITWQNVTGPSMGEAAAPLLAAQRGFDNAFGRLREELSKREATEASNFEVGKDNNTDAALAAIRQFRTPQALQEAQDSGQIDALMSRYGAQIDRRVVGQAMDLRPGVLQERVQRENRFADETLQREQRPLVDEFQSDVAAGRTAKAQGMLDNNAFFNEGQLAKYLSDSTRARTLAEQQDATNAHAVAMRPGQLALLEAQGNNLAAEAAEKQGTNAGAGIVKNAHSSFMQEGINRTNALMKVVTDLKLPVDAAGMPDVKNMMPEQEIALEAALKKGGLDVPVQNSSTALNAAREQLVKAGLNPKQVLEAEGQLTKLITSPSMSAEDRAKLEVQLKAFDASVESRRENNPFYTPATKMLAEKSSVFDTIRSGVKDGQFWTVTPFLKEAEELMTKGVDIDGTLRPVPPKLLKSILAQTLESDTVLKNNTMRDAIPLIQAYMKSPEGNKMSTDAQYFKNRGDVSDRRDVIKAFSAGTNTTNPNTWLDDFWEKRKETQNKDMPK